MINYTIIIPHKNTPDLLQYCLDSIPLRNDIQVIVVDDNSDSNIVNNDFFPLWRGKYYECYFTKEGKGAGYARNIGLKYANGKWVLFADADDFFTDKANDIFDMVVQYQSDIVYARPRSVLLSDRVSPSNRADHYNSLIDDYIKMNNETNLRIRYWSPWSKFIKLSVIKQNNVWFDEIPYSNDLFFSTKIGCVAKSISVINECLYCITESDHSLTSNFGHKDGEYRSRSLGLFHANVVMAKHKYVDMPCIFHQLHIWYESDRKLFLLGIDCMLSEGFRFPYVFFQFFTKTKTSSTRKFNSKTKTNILLFAHIIRKSSFYHKIDINKEIPIAF